MTLEASFSRFAVRRVHIREVTGSSPVVPIFSMLWSGDQGFFVSGNGQTHSLDLTVRLVSTRPSSIYHHSRRFLWEC